ncbi:MAG: hypothetical protein JO016_04105 [Actinobacteria bacterium]|nr:hypothetical protein [Actinomycetota bacterium]
MVQQGLDDLAGEAAVLRVYRQAFAVLAREAEKMILSPQLLDVDEAILSAFAASGSDGLTEEQVRNACRAFPEPTVSRRFEVLKGYGAVTKVFERPNERYYRAAFAPYIMLLFLRRIAERGGQSELHQLLSLEHESVSAATATDADGRASVERLTQVFRLIANELSIMSLGADVVQLRENAQLLWGNEALIRRAEKVHATVLERWPSLDRECQWLRAGLAAYRDAIDAAAARLIERAGTTRALGLLPAEEWRTFARTADTERLGAVLDGFVFDAPAPWFDPQVMTEAVETGGRPDTARMPPPRPVGDADPTETSPATDQDTIRATVEDLLATRDFVEVNEVLRMAPDWAAARRLLAQLTAAHHDPALPYALTWAEGLDVAEAASPAWVTPGRLTRTETQP